MLYKNIVLGPLWKWLCEIKCFTVIVARCTLNILLRNSYIDRDLQLWNKKLCVNIRVVCVNNGWALARREGWCVSVLCSVQPFTVVIHALTAIVMTHLAKPLAKAVLGFQVTGYPRLLSSCSGVWEITIHQSSLYLWKVIFCLLSLEWIENNHGLWLLLMRDYVILLIVNPCRSVVFCELWRT